MFYFDLAICSIIALAASGVMDILITNGEHRLIDDPNKRKTAKMLLLLLPFILLVGMREPRLYSDALSYWREFGRTYSWSDVLEAEKDGGWIVVQILLKKINQSPRFLMMFISALFGLTFAAFAGRNTKYRWLAVMLYVCFGLFKFQFTAMRQCTAIALCLIATRFMEKKKIIPFAICVFLAFTVHASALVFVPVFFVVFLKDNKLSRIITVAAAIVVTIFSNSIFSLFSENVADYDRYNIDYADEGGLIFAVIAVAVTIFIEINRKELLKQKPQLLPYYYLNFAFMCMCLLRVVFPMLERVKFYYLPFNIVILSESMALYWKKGDFEKILIVIAVICCLAYFWYNTKGFTYLLSF